MGDSSRLFPALPNPPEDLFSVQSKFPSAAEAGWELSLADLCFKCQGCLTLAFQIPFAFFNPSVGLGSRFWRRFCAAGAALCYDCHRSCCFMLCTDGSARAVSSTSLHEVAMCLQGLCPGQTGCQETGLRFLMTKGIHRALKILCYKMLVLIYQDSSRWMSCFHQESTSKRMHQQVHPVKGLAPLLFSPCSLHPRGLSPLPTHAQGTGIRVTVTV